jgi:hypothetical protein
MPTKPPYNGPLMPHPEMLQALEDLIGATMVSEGKSATFESLLYSLQAFISDTQRIEGPELYTALDEMLNLVNEFVRLAPESIAKWVHALQEQYHFEAARSVLLKARGEQPHGG